MFQRADDAAQFGEALQTADARVAGIDDLADVVNEQMVVFVRQIVAIALRREAVFGLRDKKCPANAFENSGPRWYRSCKSAGDAASPG
jgi:hypothetical protein